MNKITVYSTPTCPFCTMAKNYLQQKGIEFEDVNVAEDRERAMEMVKKSGQTGVPVLDVNGKVIIGFNQQAIESALA